MTILLVEDNPADVEMIRELLSEQTGTSFDIINADRLSAAKPHLVDGRIDIILLDLGLPDSQGLETLRRVREHAGEIPIVVLTMLDNETTGLNALKEGAQDYLVKGQMNGPSIIRSLRYAIERNRIEKELKTHRDSLEELVTERTQQLAGVNGELRAQYSALATKDEAIQELNRNLEKRVEERTHELQKANGELENAQEELHNQFDELVERDKLLAESEERFRISAQSVSDVIWDWNIPSGRLDWYGRIDEILGYAPDEFPRTADAWEKIIHPDDRDRVISLRDGHVKTQTPYSAEYRVIRKDGENHYWTDKGTAMLDENKSAYRMVGSCSDITPRKLAEEAQAASETRYRRLFESAQDGILILTAETGEIVEVNPYLITMLGFSREQILGKKIWEIGLFKDIVTNTDNFEELQRKEYIRYEDMPLETAYGERIAVEFVSNVYRVNNKKVIQCNIRDITERKKMADLVEASLIEKETLLREIHHRVKNNLQIISSLLSLQINKISDPRTIEALKDSQTRVQSMALVHEHLYNGKDFSRIAMRDYIKALGTKLFQSYRAEDENVRFELEIPEIYVDINTAIPLGLIINELITNSLKYAFKEKKAGKLSITATEDAQSFTIIVKDDGSGMAEGITLENQTSLGLRLVHRLTGQLHGTVRVDTTEGTKFVFKFPRPEEKPEKEPPGNTLASQPPDTVASGVTDSERFGSATSKPEEPGGRRAGMTYGRNRKGDSHGTSYPQ